MIIDNTYFNNNILPLGSFEVSNSRNGEGVAHKSIAINFSISVYEPKYLKELMGSELYAEYVDTKSDSKWTVLIDKLRNVETKRSPIANYVYFYHRRDNAIAKGDNGDFVPKTDNMQSVSINQRMRIAWDDMVSQNEDLMRWIYNSVINTDSPAIETTASWDMACWDRLLTEQGGLW